VADIYVCVWGTCVCSLLLHGDTPTCLFAFYDHRNPFCASYLHSET